MSTNSKSEKLKADAKNLHDISELSVNEHMLLSLGVMACCYQYVPRDLQQAILEACETAKKMGANIYPQNLGLFTPLTHDISQN